jgi:hypothetical protein
MERQLSQKARHIEQACVELLCMYAHCMYMGMCARAYVLYARRTHLPPVVVQLRLTHSCGVCLSDAGARERGCDLKQQCE